MIPVAEKVSALKRLGVHIQFYFVLLCTLRDVFPPAIRREIASVPSIASPEIQPVLDSERK